MTLAMEVVQQISLNTEDVNKIKFVTMGEINKKSLPCRWVYRAESISQKITGLSVIRLPNPLRALLSAPQWGEGVEPRNRTLFHGRGIMH